MLPVHFSVKRRARHQLTSKTNGARISENCYYSLVAEMKRLELSWFMKFGERRQMIGYISPPKSRRPQDFYNLVNLGKTEKLRFFSGYQFTTLFRDQISRVYGPSSTLKILWSSHVWCISEQTFKVVICLSFQEEWWWCCILSAGLPEIFARF